MTAVRHPTLRGASSPPPYPAALAVAGTGWRSPLVREGRVALARPSVQVGRMEGNDVVLSDPLVSRYHFVIRWTPSGYELEDLGSANGTYVQGQRVAGRILLAAGQAIRAGNTDVIFTALQQLDPRVVTAGYAAQPGAPPPYGAPSPYGAMPHPFYEAMAQRRGGIGHLLRTEGRKRYWRVFALGLIAYFVVMQVLTDTGNLHLVPLSMLLASALVPVVFVIFCWEQNAFADMPLGIVGLTFLSGAVLGLTIAAVVEPLLIPPDVNGTLTLGAALIIGVVEETAKVVSVAWWLRDRRLRTELDGLILGAAAGMGFAALETAGYGFVAFLTGFGQAINTPGASAGFVVGLGIRQMNRQLLVRMALAIFGHGVWTGIVCAAIWRERRGSLFRLTPAVVVAFCIAVGLHALWDWQPLSGALAPSDSTLGLAVELGWFLLIGAVGLFFLGFFLRESLRQAKLGPHAPPPPPLLRALAYDLIGRSPTPASTLVAYPAQLAPAPSQIVPALTCPHCGRTSSPGAPACSNCGSRLR